MNLVMIIYTMPKTIKIQDYEKFFKKVNRSLDKKIKVLKEDTERLKVSPKIDDTDNSKAVDLI